jgi:hypothetical protein
MNTDSILTDLDYAHSQLGKVLSAITTPAARDRIWRALDALASVREQLTETTKETPMAGKTLDLASLREDAEWILSRAASKYSPLKNAQYISLASQAIALADAYEAQQQRITALETELSEAAERLEDAAGSVTGATRDCDLACVARARAILAASDIAAPSNPG